MDASFTAFAWTMRDIRNPALSIHLLLIGSYYTIGTQWASEEMRWYTYGNTNIEETHAFAVHHISALENQGDVLERGPKALMVKDQRAFLEELVGKDRESARLDYLFEQVMEGGSLMSPDTQTVIVWSLHNHTKWEEEYRHVRIALINDFVAVSTLSGDETVPTHHTLSRHVNAETAKATALQTTSWYEDEGYDLFHLPRRYENQWPPSWFVGELEKLAPLYGYDHWLETLIQYSMDEGVPL